MSISTSFLRKNFKMANGFYVSRVATKELYAEMSGTLFLDARDHMSKKNL